MRTIEEVVNEIEDIVFDDINAGRVLAVVARLDEILRIHKTERPTRRPAGYWFVDERPESNRETICSNCEQPIFKYQKLYFDYRPHFCPNCGADMRGEENDRD